MSDETDSLSDPGAAEEAATAELATMARAGQPVIWEDYKQGVERLQFEAEALIVTDAGQVAEMKQARSLRLTLKDIRCAVERSRKSLSSEALKRKQTIDSEARTLRAIIEPLEAHLLKQEKFAEIQEEREATRRGMERAEALRPYFVDGQSTWTPALLANMESAEFDQLAAFQKHQFDERAKAAEEAEAARLATATAELAEAKAEAERVRIEGERLRLENERLEKEAAERQAEAKRRADQIARNQEAADKEAAEQERANNAALVKERAEREKVQAELKAKQDAEAAELAKEAEAKHKAASAPDREKLHALADTIDALRIPRMTTENGKKSITDIVEQINVLVGDIQEEADAL